MGRLKLAPFGLGIATVAAALLIEWGRAWALSPDLAWGWAVPVICGYFLWMRRLDLPRRSALSQRTGSVHWQAGLLLLLAAFCRLWLEPFPGWPLMEWIYSLSMLALLWLLIDRHEGRARANHLLFPLALGLVAIPWPAVITEEVIGNLRIGLAATVAEILTAFGCPAVASGTAIETGRGSVGIDEACGGIRSLQAAILVALAIGELRRERWPRRAVWLAGGIAISLFFNALRIGFLAWECAHGGTAAAEAWHDTAATAEMLLILGALGGLAMLPGARVVRRVAPEPAPPRAPRKNLLPVSMVLAILATEAAVALWFWRGRAGADRPKIWPAHLPAQLLSYEPEPYTGVMDGLLRADRHELGRWRDTSGAHRDAYVLEWNRGQRAQYVLRGHNPDICLGLAGSEPVARGQVMATAGSTPLRFESRIFRRGGSDFYVYFVAWNLTDNVPFPWASPDASNRSANAWATRWEEIAARRRSLSVRVLTIAVFDAPTAAQAEAGFREALQLITRR